MIVLEQQGARTIKATSTRMAPDADHPAPPSSLDDAAFFKAAFRRPERLSILAACSAKPWSADSLCELFGADNVASLVDTGLLLGPDTSLRASGDWRPVVAMLEALQLKARVGRARG